MVCLLRMSPAGGRRGWQYENDHIDHRQYVSTAHSSAANDRDHGDKSSLHAYKGCRPSAYYYFSFFSNYYHIIRYNFFAHMMCVILLCLLNQNFKLQSIQIKNIDDFNNILLTIMVPYLVNFKYLPLKS